MTIKKKRKFLELPEGDWVTILEECIKKSDFLDLESFLKAQLIWAFF